MLSKVNTCVISGLDGDVIEVEVDISAGLPSFSIVGLPDASVKESKDRVRSAVKNSEFDFPVRRITVNLSPADIKKEGASFDLPIAIGILSAAGLISPRKLEGVMLIGELSLDGQLKPIRGAIICAACCKRAGISVLILPRENAGEAALLPDVRVYGAGNIKEVAGFLNGEIRLQEACAADAAGKEEVFDIDFKDVRGQMHAKRALEIAAAGNHNVLMIGPPGSGKTMLAKRLVTILPPMNFEEALENTKIYSIAEKTKEGSLLLSRRAFRSPHHTISDVGLVGGGKSPKPGEVTLANNGVLFLDEMPEFSRNALEVLRQPLEDRIVNVSRSMVSLTFPASFMLVGAMNPCPCGYHTHPEKECKCSPLQIEKYMAKISGPLWDRIDIHLQVPAVSFKDMTDKKDTGPASADIRKRIASARGIQQERYKNERINWNSELHSGILKKYCQLEDSSQALIDFAMQKLTLSARAYNKILTVARTIADLSECSKILKEHVSEAIQLRSMDRRQNH